ncbi:MAG: uncharacterized protein KVP18_001916 [Porospora cf. gigantea A]|nr:MAG: hypothetical protein KVP18_001916 [Porospora cf. gigantea A]
MPLMRLNETSTNAERAVATVVPLIGAAGASAINTKSDAKKASVKTQPTSTKRASLVAPPTTGPSQRKVDHAAADKLFDAKAKGQMMGPMTNRVKSMRGGKALGTNTARVVKKATTSPAQKISGTKSVYWMESPQGNMNGTFGVGLIFEVPGLRRHQETSTKDSFMLDLFAQTLFQSEKALAAEKSEDVEAHARPLGLITSAAPLIGRDGTIHVNFSGTEKEVKEFMKTVAARASKPPKVGKGFIMYLQEYLYKHLNAKTRTDTRVALKEIYHQQRCLRSIVMPNQVSVYKQMQETMGLDAEAVQKGLKKQDVRLERGLIVAPTKDNAKSLLKLVDPDDVAVPEGSPVVIRQLADVCGPGKRLCLVGKPIRGLDASSSCMAFPFDPSSPAEIFFVQLFKRKLIASFQQALTTLNDPVMSEYFHLDLSVFREIGTFQIHLRWLTLGTAQFKGQTSIREFINEVSDKKDREILEQDFNFMKNSVMREVSHPMDRIQRTFEAIVAGTDQQELNVAQELEDVSVQDFITWLEDISRKPTLCLEFISEADALHERSLKKFVKSEKRTNDGYEVMKMPDEIEKQLEEHEDIARKAYNKYVGTVAAKTFNLSQIKESKLVHTKRKPRPAAKKKGGHARKTKKPARSSASARSSVSAKNSGASARSSSMKSASVKNDSVKSASVKSAKSAKTKPK